MHVMGLCLVKVAAPTMTMGYACGPMAWVNAAPKHGSPGRKTMGHIYIGDIACTQQGGLHKKRPIIANIFVC